jgi:hypothetical protein
MRGGKIKRCRKIKEGGEYEGKEKMKEKKRIRK